MLHVLKDTVPGQFIQAEDVFEKVNRSALSTRAYRNSVIRNILLAALPTYLLYLHSPPTIAYALLLVAYGAIALGYVSLRIRVNDLDFTNSADSDRFASPSNRQTYFDALNTADAFQGWILVVIGFLLQVIFQI